MDIEILKALIEQNLSQRDIAKALDKSQTTVKHWLNKYNLKTKYRSFKNGDCTKFCPNCKEIKKSSEFYIKTRISSWCKTCNTQGVRERQRAFKIICVEYKGGKCSRCEYATYIGALEFHHLDPSEKDFEISKYRSNKFDDRAKKELDKCILVCSNCHKEIHSSV